MNTLYFLMKRFITGDETWVSPGTRNSRQPRHQKKKEVMKNKDLSIGIERKTSLW